MDLQPNIHANGPSNCRMSGKACKRGVLISVGGFKAVYYSKDSFMSLVEMFQPPVDEEELEAIRLRIINGGKS